MPVVEDYDVEDIRKYLGEFSYEKCKIVMMGKDILSNKELLEKAGKPTSGLMKEKWTLTKYKNFEKTSNSSSVYADRQEEWEEVCSLMHRPTKNRFVPENLETLVPSELRQTKNVKPKRIRISDDKDGGRIDLYHLVDSVHLKPMTQVDVVLRLRQPSKRAKKTGK